MKLTGKKLDVLAKALSRALSDLNADLGRPSKSDEAPKLLQERADLLALQARTEVLRNREAGSQKA